MWFILEDSARAYLSAARDSPPNSMHRQRRRTLSHMTCLAVATFGASHIAAGATFNLSVERHPFAFDLTPSEFERIIQGSQKIISEACKRDRSGQCRISMSQGFRNADEKDKWVQIEPKTIFTEPDMQKIASQSNRNWISIYVVRRIQGCASHPGEIIAGCTVGLRSIFLTLLSNHKQKGKNGRDVRDQAWFDEQSIILAHELGHVAGLPDLCCDRFAGRLMFRTEHVVNRALSAKECSVYEKYPAVPSDSDLEIDIRVQGNPVNFANQTVGAASAPKIVALKNTSSGGIAMGDIVLDNTIDFAMLSDCPKPGYQLAARAACSVRLTFTPRSTGEKTATLTIVDCDVSSPQSVSITGTGIKAYRQ